MRPLLPWLLASVGLHALWLAELPQPAPARITPAGLQVQLRPALPLAAASPGAVQQAKPQARAAQALSEARSQPQSQSVEDRALTPTPARPLAEVMAAIEADAGGVLSRPFDTSAPPANLHWRYRLQTAEGEGVAELSWEQDGEHYRASLLRRVGARELPQWQSSGRLVDWGLQPLRFEHLRNGRVREALSFEPETAQLWHSARTEARHLPDATQDRLSWILQLAAWLNGRAWHAEELQVDLWIVGWRGEPQHWEFVPQRNAPQDGLLHLRGRRGFGAHEIEVWLDPNREYLPVRLLHAIDGEPRSEWQFEADLTPAPGASAPP
ncbi:hypothetical protein HNQ51_002239 [Inhella inkyongensis]|uniref:DUF3108 domain-containing protein n=1 Tax=Inhella inkyongensis TaxID=392593 RepID=A0A840S925_9BURK|nr:hypothetical protein [Inhella inkyongensis]MBB5204920.1 hypothetical protein [Inhella inkyongensis]